MMINLPGCDSFLVQVKTKLYQGIMIIIMIFFIIFFFSLERFRYVIIRRKHFFSFSLLSTVFHIWIIIIFFTLHIVVNHHPVTKYFHTKAYCTITENLHLQKRERGKMDFFINEYISLQNSVPSRNCSVYFRNCLMNMHRALFGES